MKDIEISNLCMKKNILEVAEKIGLDEDLIECYGKYKAKLSDDVYKKVKNGSASVYERDA